MAHHQGMSLLSTANFLDDEIGRKRRFHRNPQVQATALLLQEKPAGRMSSNGSHAKVARVLTPRELRKYSTRVSFDTDTLMRRLHSLALAVLLALSSSVALVSAQPDSKSEIIVVDAKAASHPFPHFWEQMFGSGRAILSLRESYRNDLRAVKHITDFNFVRFHGILDDEVGIYTDDSQGAPVYNFSYIDQIYDGLLANREWPFVELGFMPNGG